MITPRTIFQERRIEPREIELVIKPFVIFKSVREVARHLKIKEWKAHELIGKIICPLSYKNQKGQEVIVGYADMLEMARYGALYVADAPDWMEVLVKTRTVKDKRKPKYNALFYPDGRPKYLIIKDKLGNESLRSVGPTETKNIPRFKLIQKGTYGRALSKLGVSLDDTETGSDNRGRNGEEKDKETPYRSEEEESD